MKRNRNLIIILCCMAITLTGQAFGGDAASDSRKTKFTKHFKETYFAITDKGEFSLEILPDEKEYKIGRNVIGIVIHDKKDQDVEGAALVIIAEGSKEKASVKEKGEGLYIVSNVDLRQPGAWKLTVQVKKRSLADGATFAFPAGSAFLPQGKYDQESLSGR
ncbi:MAG: hypothetical protein EPN25_08170 [Nitrospirae bacterium]|nr:MAG: hypothetical protein EPN25_08170 [Nitrospirota bacterium]